MTCRVLPCRFQRRGLSVVDQVMKLCTLQRLLISMGSMCEQFHHGAGRGTIGCSI